MPDSLDLLHAAWDIPVFTATTTVKNGCSSGPYASNNMGLHVHDNLHDVYANRAKLQDCLRTIHADALPIQWVEQVHGNVVYHAQHPIQRDEVPLPCEADAIYTQVPQQPIAIMTADCMAIFLSDANGSEVAVLHAGWRGLLDGVIENTLACFAANRTNIRAWIAPCISQRYFEVDAELLPFFADFDAVAVANPQTNKWHIDLAKCAYQVLRNSGVDKTQTSGLCTYADTRFYSHRRATHQGLHMTGRMANLIMINP